MSSGAAVLLRLPFLTPTARRLSAEVVFLLVIIVDATTGRRDAAGRTLSLSYRCSRSQSKAQ